MTRLEVGDSVDLSADLRKIVVDIKNIFAVVSLANFGGKSVVFEPILQRQIEIVIKGGRHNDEG